MASLHSGVYQAQFENGSESEKGKPEKAVSIYLCSM